LRSFPPRALLYGLLLVAGLFIWRSAELMPAMVASHFIGSGAANAYAPRASYVRIMLLAGVALPALLAELIGAITRFGGGVRIPNRDYWMAPERRERSLAFMVSHARWFGCLLSAFICYVHWLVIGANRAQPPLLPPDRIVPALIVFVICAVAWGLSLQLRFLRRG
jgi:hypothetical protein